MGKEKVGSEECVEVKKRETGQVRERGGERGRIEIGAERMVCGEEE